MRSPCRICENLNNFHKIREIIQNACYFLFSTVLSKIFYINSVYIDEIIKITPCKSLGTLGSAGPGGFFWRTELSLTFQIKQWLMNNHHKTKQHNTTQHNTTQHNTTQHNTKQNKTKQKHTKQNKQTKQNKTKQKHTKQNKTKQNKQTNKQTNKTKQNKTTQNNTKQNKTKQNKTKQNRCGSSRFCRGLF